MTTEKKPIDVLIIGSGSAGLAAAEAVRENGARRVVLVEREKRLGGECPNRGCVPTKALLRSVELIMHARRAREFGVKIPSVGADMSTLMRRKQAIVDTLTGGDRLEKALKGLGVELIRGNATFTGTHAVDVDGASYAAQRIIIATGSEPFIPPVAGLRETKYWTSDDIVSIPKIPASLVIIGGGPIGAEWAQILAPLGVKITIVEFLGQLLPREDTEIAEVVAESFKKQGIAVFVNTKTTNVDQAGEKFRVTVQPAKGASRVLDADAVLVATGKRPAVAGLHLEQAGVRVDERGAPVLNDYLQTTNRDIFVAGDAAGRMMFTHVAHLQGEVAGANAAKTSKKKSDLSVIPRGTFCFPEVGSVGLTEQDARKKGIDVVVGRGAYSYLGKALVSGEKEGLVKLLVDRKTKRVVGGHIVGESAAELVHEVALAMAAKIPYTVLAEMVHAYPTYAEAIGIAAYDITL